MGLLDFTARFCGHDRRADIPVLRSERRIGIIFTAIAAVAVTTLLTVVLAPFVAGFEPSEWDNARTAVLWSMLGVLVVVDWVRLHAVYRLHRETLACDKCGKTLRDGAITRRGIVCPWCRTRTALFVRRKPKSTPRVDEYTWIGPIKVWLGEPHRRFPTLRRFPSEVGERYHEEALEWSAARLHAAGFAAFFLGYVIGVATFLVCMQVERRLIGLSANDDLSMVATLFEVLLTGTTGIVAGYSIHWRALRAAVARRLQNDHCGRCGYTLDGITPRDGVFTCPECAADIPLDPGPEPPSVCAGCRYSLHGIPLSGHSLVCPECGRANPLIPTTDPPTATG